MASMQLKCNLTVCRDMDVYLDDSEIESHISAKHLDYFPLKCAWCEEGKEGQKHFSATKEDMKKHTSKYHNGKNAQRVERVAKIESNGQNDHPNIGSENYEVHPAVLPEVKPSVNISIVEEIPSATSTEPRVEVEIGQIAVDPISNPEDDITSNAVILTKLESDENISTVPIGRRCLDLQAALSSFVPIDIEANEDQTNSVTTKTFRKQRISRKKRSHLGDSSSNSVGRPKKRMSLPQQSAEHVPDVSPHPDLCSTANQENAYNSDGEQNDERRTSYHTPIAPASIKVFDKELTSEAYNEWVSRNSYSKQASIDGQVASTQSSQNARKEYKLFASAYYNDLNHREWDNRTIVFSAEVEVNHENWPVFQHFVRLATDPFIYIDCMDLTPQNDVLNLLAGAINSDRLQCKKLIFNLNGNSQKSITWAKNHVRCNRFYIYGEAGLNQDEAFLDFLVTGAHCTTSINVGYHHVSKALVEFVQKFLDLENWDEYQGVQSIEGFHFVKDQDIQVLKKDYSKFIVKEERDEDDGSTEHVFEFTNNAIGKKLQLTITIFDDEDDYWYFGSPTFSLKINNL
ncbi:hypothetical protein DdX_20433 [Ditylenchus destructor]|uniref:Uncharacterized protein n=1 Tax=Ditylenchus destructor TaxID=166010 RepID=A0AAD4MI30_9BILA|nr:hypothetical protein DdX_20433 [Ditylenchus destructor]